MVAMFAASRAPANRLAALGIKNKQAAISAVPIISESLRKDIVIAILKQKGSYQIRRRQDLDEGTLKLKKRKLTLSGKVKWRVGMPMGHSINTNKYRQVEAHDTSSLDTIRCPACDTATGERKKALLWNGVE